MQKLNEIQREILVGILLGDAHLESQLGKWRLKIEQSDFHKVYAQHPPQRLHAGFLNRIFRK